MAGMAAHNPKSRSRDMIISMSVILVPVLLLVFFFTRPAEQTPERVDVASMLERAQAEGSYPLLEAQELGEGWVPVRVAFAADGEAWITGEPADGDSWQVGYLSPDEIYFGVQQRNDNEAQFVDTVTRDGSAVGGEVEAVGRSWQRYESKDGRTRSLVSERDGVTSVISADTDFVQLEAFAAHLVEVGTKSA